VFLNIEMSLAKARKPQNRPEAGASPAARVLDWYDRHARVLPWRARAGERADPYHVWLSEIMLQQTTVRAVGPYFEKFLNLWPDVNALASADREAVLRAWAGLGYYARARNLHACAIAVANEHGGVFPDTLDGLRRLPGIGPYTASAIAAIAFDIPARPVDGNIERVVARLFAIEEPVPKAKPLICARAETLLSETRPGDLAQALMDLGATICTPKSPACALCPLSEDCAGFKRGEAQTFPRKAPKTNGKKRRGAAFVVLRGEAMLLRTRPDKGLLGGMSEVPTSAWSADFDEKDALQSAPTFSGRRVRWRKLPGTVSHVFTHFPLELSVYVGHVPPGTRAPKGTRFVALKDVPREALPNVMRKVLAQAGEHNAPALNRP